MAVHRRRSISPTSRLLGAVLAAGCGAAALTCAQEPPQVPWYLEPGAGGARGVACASGRLLQAPAAGGGDAGGGGMTGSAGAGAVPATAGATGTAGGAGAGAAGAGGGAGSTGRIVPVRATPWLHVDGNQIKDPQGNLVVLRGVAFPDLGELEFTEGGIRQMIDRVTNPVEPAGGCSPSFEARVVRLAVSPPDGDAHTPKQYTPGTDYYDTLLRPTVDYLKQKGLYAIIDWHYIADTTAHQSTTSAFWTEMAPKFANDSNVLFELYNEPINGGNWQTVKPDMQVWHDIVRQAAPRNLILVGSANWDQLVAAATADPVQGHDLVFVAHMYPDHWKQVSLRQLIASAAKRFPIAITEWGFDSTAGILGGSIDDYGAPFRDFVRELNISWTAWCASTSWRPTMFNRDFTLRTGDRVMGGFVKDWLYEDKDKNQPAASPP